MNIIELETAEQNGRTWNGAPEWDCVCKDESGNRFLLSRQAQWNKPSLEHVKETAIYFPTLFKPV